MSWLIKLIYCAFKIMEYETERNIGKISTFNVIMNCNYTLKTEPKPPCPSLLVRQKLLVAATMQLRSKIDKSGYLLLSSSSFPSKYSLVPVKFNDWLCNSLFTVRTCRKTLLTIISQWSGYIPLIMWRTSLNESWYTCVCEQYNANDFFTFWFPFLHQPYIR